MHDDISNITENLFLKENKEDVVIEFELKKIFENNEQVTVILQIDGTPIEKICIQRRIK